MKASEKVDSLSPILLLRRFEIKNNATGTMQKAILVSKSLIFMILSSF
jgi:hypothetical protein